MQAQPLWSIVIPTFNPGKILIDYCTDLTTFFKQQNEAVEIIIVNDKSTDIATTQQILQQLPEAIILIENNKNLGQNKATVVGINRAKGRYIITLDDDYQYPIDSVKQVCNEIKQNPQLDLLFTQSLNKTRKRDIFSQLVYQYITWRGYSRSNSLRIIKRSKMPQLDVKNLGFGFQLNVYLYLNTIFILVVHYRL